NLITKIIEKYRMKRLRREIIKYYAASVEARQKCAEQFRFIEELQVSEIAVLTNKPWIEVINLRESLQISYGEILEFYKEAGFLPSPGFSIVLKHFGVQTVIKNLRDNLKLKHAG